LDNISRAEEATSDESDSDLDSNGSDSDSDVDSKKSSYIVRRIEYTYPFIITTLK
jgi:hypothetical protein